MDLIADLNLDDSELNVMEAFKRIGAMGKTIK